MIMKQGALDIQQLERQDVRINKQYNIAYVSVNKAPTIINDSTASKKFASSFFISKMRNIQSKQ